MLKRYIKVPHKTTVGLPQPIDDLDKQRLVELSDPQAPINAARQVAGDSSLRDLAARGAAEDDLTNDLTKGYSLKNHLAEDRLAQGSSSEKGSTDDVVTDQRANFVASAGRFHVSADMPSQETARIQQLQQYISQQHHLRQVERKLRKSLNLSTIFGTTVIETAALFGATQVSLLRYCSELNALEMQLEPTEARDWQQVARYCKNQAWAWQHFAIAQTEFPHLMGQLQQGKLLQISKGLASDVSVDSATADAPHERAPSLSRSLVIEMRQWLAYWPGNWLLVPIDRHQLADEFVCELPKGDTVKAAQAEGNHWGVMALSLPEISVWTDSAIAAAQSIAFELALAMRQSQQYQELLLANQELQKLALSDGLTCLANRRRFDEHLADEWQRLARDQQPLSLILCDLDHFKRYNDTFGHPAGDRCLIRVARALLNGPQRPADLVARYGGEEFAIILPNTDTHGAWRIAQKIHESIRALKIAHAPDNDQAYVTVTMGVSTVIPGHDTTAQMLVQAADLALYHAKQQGRNRTYVHAHYNTVSADDMGSATGESQPAMTPIED
jgi:diguanylate cyclase (GGDEF)-like protein